MISDLPPTIFIDDASIGIYCSVEAVARYFLPSEPVYAVALTEGGDPAWRLKTLTAPVIWGICSLIPRTLRL